ncbi:hypothetical protein F2Q69_00045649 [Brassica cretica]|uniref:Uncharacterized protein n=1 Tax=Brassica cretica TaxID=69181 RepID=A0A8S9NHS8_BRACR|nr:hypothetical protein F2Q69_00045649 [Brassica cretica]
MGGSFRSVFTGFWSRRVEACKAPRCRLGTRGIGSWAVADEISVDDEALRQRRGCTRGG